MPIRLLIADDNAEFRKSIELMVSSDGDIQVVSQARDGSEVVEMARQHQPDVAIIDVHMPRLDGLTAIRMLGGVSPATICMAMSYDGDREIMRRAMAAGAREYLIKPFNADEFLGTIRRVARRADPSTVGVAPSSPLPGPITSALDPHAVEGRDQQLIQTAVSYLKGGRADREAAKVYAELVALSHLDSNTLTRLAEIFLARRDWPTLRLICERLEKSTFTRSK